MMNTFYHNILQEATSMQDWMRDYRRDLHKYPEMGWCEIRTSSLIARRLTELGYQVLVGPDVCQADARMGLPSREELDTAYRRALEQGADPAFAERAKNGFTGVIGILDCGAGPTIALRFDIDALGVMEDNGAEHRPTLEGFRSVNDGVMHACGHDGHITMGLAVAELLMAHRNELKGKLKLIFQPAEEGVRGAKAIVANGHLDDCDYVIGNHISDPVGAAQIGVSFDTTLATSKLDITFEGKAVHAGIAPEMGANALLAAATAVLNMHAIPRHSGGDSRINVGTLQAGTGRNVVCDRATLQAEVRGATTEVNAYVERYARCIVEAAASMHRCTSIVTLAGAAEAMQSDPGLVRRCEQVARKKLGFQVVELPNGASEDCAYMLNRVHNHGGRGVYFMTLSACAGPFHSAAFDFQEEALVNGAAMFCALAYSLQHEGPVVD